MRIRYRRRRAALVFVLLGACYGGGSEALSEYEHADEQDRAAHESDDFPSEAGDLGHEPSLEEQAEAEFLANLLHELEASYAAAKGARIPEPAADGALDEPVLPSRDALEFAQQLAEELQATSSNSPSPNDAGAPDQPRADDAAVRPQDAADPP